MNHRTATATLAIVTAGLIANHASAHELRGYLSSSGLEFVGDQVPYLVPKDLYPPDMSKDFACMTGHQRDTHVSLTINDFELSIPRAGQVRLYVNLSAYGTGKLIVDDAYGCFGQMRCNDEFILNDARATIDFDVMLDDGEPTAIFESVDLQIAEDDLDVNFSDCAADDVANWMIDFAKEYVTDYLLSKIEDMAKKTLGPKVAEMMGSMGNFNGLVGSTQFDARLDDLFVNTDGIDIGAHIDLSSEFPAAECVREFDPGAPTDFNGPIPDLTEVPSHMGLAANFGLLNNAMYQAWRQGMTCMTGDHLEELGIHLPAEHIMQLLPGFPPGTELGMEMRLTSPPSIRGTLGSDVNVTLAIDGIQVALIANKPDGTQKRIEIELDIEASATAGINRDSNALVATPTDVKINRMVMDQLYATETGFDVVRTMEVMHNHMLPKMLAHMGEMPLTGPVFAAGGYAVILRGLGNNDSYMTVNADLFRIPTDDIGSPETSILAYPNGAVNPHDANIRVSGTDGRIPTELLQYVVSVNGEDRPATYIRDINVGTPGQSGIHVVQVRSVDLSGNVDQTPAQVELTIDGIAPTVVVDGGRVREMDGGTADLSWAMRDDMTETNRLASRVELYVVNDKSDALDITHLRTIELEAGATSAMFDIEDGEIYRAEIHVTDEVGNESVVTVMLDSADKGGCSASGKGTALPLGLALMAAMLLVRRRRLA